mmetsp:Transcript_45250/g.84435  ORF Transcript_45250/g.84435 Transcript_45250/m.84435 type:complete len:163 (+) Transcript_45250:68-556(+)
MCEGMAVAADFNGACASRQRDDGREGLCEGACEHNEENEESCGSTGSPSEGSEVSSCPNSEDLESLTTAELTGIKKAGSRHVEFDMNSCEVHEVIPYSEIYGIHPRDFVFAKDYSLVPAFRHLPIDCLAARALLERRLAAGQQVSCEDEDFSDSSGSDSEPW